ncbi:unnamed protein product [Victoria cruziana]
MPRQRGNACEGPCLPLSLRFASLDKNAASLPSFCLFLDRKQLPLALFVSPDVLLSCSTESNSLYEQQINLFVTLSPVRGGCCILCPLSCPSSFVTIVILLMIWSSMVQFT